MRLLPDQDGISDKVLDRQVTINSASPVLTFRNNFNSEFSDGVFWDGGVLEVSTPSISGGDFLDITDSHVGGTIVSWRLHRRDQRRCVESVGGPDGVERRFRRIHRHGDQSGTEPERTNDHVAMALWIGRSGSRAGVVDRQALDHRSVLSVEKPQIIFQRGPWRGAAPRHCSLKRLWAVAINARRGPHARKSLT